MRKLLLVVLGALALLAAPAVVANTEAAQQGDGSSFGFQAEVSRLMDILIHSLYSNREIFLRELISNASDALDKLRFLALTEKDVLGGDDIADLDIRIKYDKDLNTISVIDRGIGMSKEELIKNLGTVAKSGTSQFVDAASKGGADPLSLIGQFGVGFYSVFLVADKVQVISKSNNDPVQHVWESSQAAKFTVSEDPRGNTMKRGTEVKLFLKEDAIKEFLDQDRLEKLVTKYSQFINFPIYLHKSRMDYRDVPVEEDLNEQAKEEEEATEEAATETETEQEKTEDVEVSEDGEAEADASSEEETTEEKPALKTEAITVWEWKLLNEHKPIWTRSSNSVPDHEYKEFYKALTKEADREEPLIWSHFQAEGGVEFKALLYVPGWAPANLYDNYYGKQQNLKLYVRRVLIGDEFDNLIPRYLSFMKGVVDSDDLPLNVNREQLQKSKIIDLISKKLTRKALETLKELADESEKELEEAQAKAEEDNEDSVEAPKETKYDKFWKLFGKSIKLGLVEDSKNKLKLQRLLRFPSSFSPEKPISLDSYIKRMKPKQEYIYWASGESLAAVKNAPFLERLQKKGYEVLFLVDPLDEYVIGAVTEYDHHKLMAAAKEGIKLGKDDSEEKKLKDMQDDYKPLLKFLKELFSEKVEKVTLSTRLAKSPAVLVTPQYGWSANMQRIMKAQALTDRDRSQFLVGKKILEVNPWHPIVKELKKRVDAGTASDDQRLRDQAEMLYDACLVTSGFGVDDPTTFSDRLYRVLKANLDLDPTAEAEEPEFEEEAQEETKPADEEESTEAADAEFEDAPQHEDL